MDYSNLYRKAVECYSLIPKFCTPGYALPPLQIYVEVTYRCNLRCRFCQFIADPDTAAARPDNDPPARDEIPIEHLDRILSKAPRSALVSFSGGEPFARKGFLPLAERVSRRNKVHIYTNATLIDREAAARLVSLGARNLMTSGLVLIDVSLEGLEHTHNRIVQRPRAYRRTVEAVRNLVAARTRAGKRYPLIELKAVITRDNLLELCDLFETAEELGADLFNIMVMNTIPQAGRSEGSLGTDPFRTPAPVTDVDPVILRRQLDRLARTAGRSRVQIRTTPQGFGWDEIVAYYHGSLPRDRYRCHFPWYAFGITAFGDAVICPYGFLGPVDPADPWALLNGEKARTFRRLLRGQELFPGCLGCCMMVPKP